MKLFFSTFADQRQYIKKCLIKSYPEFQSGGFFYRKNILENINKNFIVLDAGCGSGGMIADFKGKFKQIIGIDSDQKKLEQNNIVDEKIWGDLSQIPYENNSFDLVLSEFVIEHLLCSIKVFQEIHRVLRPTGKFIFITPNIYNPIMLGSKILPTSIHSFYRQCFLNRQDGGEKTYYRVNSYQRLLNLGKASGFSKLKLQRAGNPEYLGVSPWLANISILGEKFIDNKYLDFLKMYLIGCFEK